MKRLNSKAVARLYGVSVRQARRYMHDMGCKSTPLYVTRAQIADWEAKKGIGVVDYEKAVRDFDKMREEAEMRFRMRCGR